jgi:hypothetical protein
MGGHAKDTPESIAAKAADRPRLDRDFMHRLDALRAMLRMQLYTLGLRSSPDEDIEELCGEEDP